ncbi:MAG: hypothetical protein O6927_02960, partial [Gammaproteobacteria bacterium]|nr:hypothetical protein [Gammaproteobacteria bacterium]
MRYLIRLLTKFLSWALVLLALGVVGLRVGLANIDYFEAEIKIWLVSEVSSGISFVGIQGDWNRFNPILRLENASLFLPNQDQAVLIDEMVVELDLVKSLWLQTPWIREVSGTIKNLNLRKDRAGQWWLNELILGGVGNG